MMTNRLTSIYLSASLYVMTQLLTVTELAARYSVPVRTIQYWCKTGELPAKKLGRDWVVDEEDARKFMAEREIISPEE